MLRRNGVQGLKSQIFIPQSAFLSKVRPGSIQGRGPVERCPEMICSIENLHANTLWLDPDYQGQPHRNLNCSSKSTRSGARAVILALFLYPVYPELTTAR